MTKIPTDLKILNAIYDRYYNNFKAYSDANKIRSSKIYVPIDIEQLSRSMDIDPDIIFGRLYYHLNNKFSYKKNDGLQVDLFSLRIGDDKNCVNYPYLASILADLKDQNTKYLITTIIAVSALIIAILSIVITTLN